jgi:hypothetical protein
MSMAPKNNNDPLLKEVLTTTGGEEVDPKILELAIKIIEKMFLKMKEDKAEKKQGERPKKKKKGRRSWSTPTTWLNS